MNVKSTITTGHLWNSLIRSLHSKKLEIIKRWKNHKNKLVCFICILDDRFNKIKNTYNYIKFGINIYDFP